MTSVYVSIVVGMVISGAFVAGFLVGKAESKSEPVQRHERMRTKDYEIIPSEGENERD